MKRRLGELKKGESGRIVSVSGEVSIVERLLGMGLIEGSKVEVMHEAPWGGDPIAIRVRGALIAIRRSEANVVEVAPEEVAMEQVAMEEIGTVAVKASAKKIADEAIADEASVGEEVS